MWREFLLHTTTQFAVKNSQNGDLSERKHPEVTRDVQTRTTLTHVLDYLTA